MEDIDIPENIFAAANTVRVDLLPDKSKIHYEKEYLQFYGWQDTEQVQSAGETVILAYFVKFSNPRHVILCYKLVWSRRKK